jgi:hypothetical protein
MRRIAKIDSNQTEIVGLFRQAGYSVQSLAQLGNGVPDLLIARNGVNHLVEIKDGEKSPSGQRLTKDQFDWIAKWKGRVRVVSSKTDAVAMIEST